MSSRVGRAFRLLTRIDDPPHRTAVAFGIGVYIAFFPVLGVHTALALAIAFLFRLNRVAIIVGTYINNPWTIAPLYGAGTALGCVMLGVAAPDLERLEWSIASLKPYLGPFVVGNTVLGVLGGLAGYLLLWRMLPRRLASEADGVGAAEPSS